MRIAEKRGLKRARVALARKLAVIMHRMWLDGSEFRWTDEAPAQGLGTIAPGVTPRSGANESASAGVS